MKSNQDIFKKLLIAPKSKIKRDIQSEIINNLFDCFIQYGKDLLYIDGGQISRITSRKAFETIAYFHLITKFEKEEIKSYDEEKNKYRWNIKISDIYDTITSVNTYDLLTYESDLFLSSQQVLKDNLSKTVTVVNNKMNIKQPKTDLNFNDNEVLEVVADYKKHFPFFDELLNLIIDMRLAKDRKASFVHLRVKSNWGKSFLSGLLQNLQIGFEIDYHNLMNKGANDIHPIQVRNSSVLILDEFNNFSSEMKKLSHYFKFAPKFGMTEKVELYLKILMSAEKSPSFSNGVDDQIVNRVMVMDIDDKTAQKLTSRLIYKKYGNAKYMAILEKYSYGILTKRLSEYLEMEKFEAHKLADIRVNESLKKYKMKNISNLNDETKNVINEEIENILNLSDMELSPRHKEIKKNLIEIDDNIFIRQPRRTIEMVLKLSVSEGDYKKMKWKLSDLESILSIISDHRITPKKINNKATKGILITTKDKNIIKMETEEPSENIIKNHSQSIPVVVEDKNGKVIKNDTLVISGEEVS